MSALYPKFLQTPPDADALLLLGLTPANCSPAAVDEALRRRVAQVYRHPDVRSDEAEDVRRALRAAAAALKNPAQRARILDSHPYVAPPPQLTPFDRDVLSILIGSGGWNALSRTRLVALAAGHGVTPQGLMKVISGLNRYAGQGGGRLNIASIVRGGVPAVSSSPAAMERLGEISDSLIERYTPELKEESAPATIKLSILFGLLTLLVIMVVFRLVLPGGRSHIAQAPSPTVSPSEPAIIAPSPEQSPAVVAPPPHRPLAFDALPTFTLITPDKAVRAAEAAKVLPETLDLLTRQIAITDEPSLAVYRSWDVSIEEAATAWFVLEESLRREIQVALMDVLFAAAGKPTVSDRLLEPLQIPSERMHEPIALWRRAWTMYLLAQIGQHEHLPPVIVDQARTNQALAFQAHQLSAPARQSPEHIAALWLDGLIPWLFDQLAYDDRALEHWSCWIIAQRTLRRGEELQHALLNVVERFVTGNADITSPGAARSVLGRVLGRVLESLDFQRSPIVRDRLMRLLENDAVDARELWVLTSMIHALDLAPWFDERFVLSRHADERLRRRYMQDLDAQWPTIPDAVVTAQARPNIDEPTLARWLDLDDRLRHDPDLSTRHTQMAHLAAVTMLNEAATLLFRGRADRSHTALDRIERFLDEGEFRQSAARSNTNPRGFGGGRSGRVPAATRGPDGIWAAEYEQARRNTDERLRLLRALRQHAGGDLGPIDAALFIREVYRGSPTEVRERAREVLLQQFRHGPTVALQMLDQLYNLPRTQSLSDLIANYTDTILPDTRHETWLAEVRLALVRHRLSLRPGPDSIIDDRAADVEIACANQAAALRNTQSSAVVTVTPTDAARERYRAWRDAARSLVPPSAAIPAELPDLERRHETRLTLADGPIQQFVAHQVSTIECMAYVAAAEQPQHAARFAAVLETSHRKRDAAQTVLVQAAEAERTMAQLWRLMLNPHQDEPAEKEEEA